jgi:antitoxin HicB
MKRVETELGYKVIYEPNELGGYCVYVPTLNGLATCGRTLDHARFMARDAIEGYLEVLQMKGLPVPREKQQVEPQQLKPTTVTSM